MEPGPAAGGSSPAPGAPGRRGEVHGVAVCADTHGFQLAIVRQCSRVRRAAGTEDLWAQGRRGAEQLQEPRSPLPGPSPPITFPQLRQWCRRRSRVKGARQAQHWLHVLSGTHSGRLWAPDGENTKLKAPPIASSSATSTSPALRCHRAGTVPQPRAAPLTPHLPSGARFPPWGCGTGGSRPLGVHHP